jgi:hypothetical protein
MRFLIREALGTATVPIVFTLTRGCEWALEGIEDWIPIHNAQASAFLHYVFQWGASITTGFLWIMITYYEVRELRRNLTYYYGPPPRAL